MAAQALSSIYCVLTILIVLLAFLGDPSHADQQNLLFTALLTANLLFVITGGLNIICFDNSMALSDFTNYPPCLEFS